MQCKECKDVAPPLNKDFVYWECSCFKINQPERLNPKDVRKGTSPVKDDGTPYIHICDSPNTANK